MSHPQQAQILDRLSHSTGHAVGWRPLAQRAVLSVMLGLSMVAIAPAAAAQTPPEAQVQQVQQATGVAQWWGQAGLGFSPEQFEADLKGRGFTSAQAVAAYQWMDHLSAPTFGVDTQQAKGWTHQGLEDRAEYSATLVQAIEQGPQQFDAWQASTIEDFKQLISGLSADDSEGILQVQEYADALGVMPVMIQQLVENGQWGNEPWSWSGVKRVIDADLDARSFTPGANAGLTMGQARDNLLQAVQETGLRWFRAPVVMMQTPQDVQGLADMLVQANLQVQQQTGLVGPALGLNGRMSWDMATPPGQDLGITNEHAAGIAVRGTQEIFFHEFTHALGAAMNADVGIATMDGSMSQLLQAMEEMELPHSPQIHAERWQALFEMAEDMGIPRERSQWLEDAGSLTREDIRARLLSEGVSRLNASYLSANVDILNAQKKEGQTLAFVAYRNAVLTAVAADGVDLPIDYLLDGEETVAYQAQYRVPGADPVDTWQTPTASEKKMQDQLWEAYYAKARAWQRADLEASGVVVGVDATTLSFADRINSRRAAAAPQVDLAPSQPRTRR